MDFDSSKRAAARLLAAAAQCSRCDPAVFERISSHAGIIPNLETAITAPWWINGHWAIVKTAIHVRTYAHDDRIAVDSHRFMHALGVFVVVGALAAVLALRFQPRARNYVIAALRQHYKSDVSLGDLSISLFPQVRATGDNLVFRLTGNPDTPPLVIVRRFTLDADFVGFFRAPRHIRKLTLEGLELHIPPKSGRPNGTKGGSLAPLPFVLEKIVADGAILQTLPSDPRKLPLKFEIRQLTLHDVGQGLPMTFRAALDNAKPPGLIPSKGDFGPWNPDEPGDTPVSGKYTFRDASLAVFPGIAGTLASDGQYHGALDRIEVEGNYRRAGFRAHYGTPSDAPADPIFSHSGWHERQHGFASCACHAGEVYV